MDSEVGRHNYLDSIKKYGNQLALDHENECPICFEEFKEDQELVELDCDAQVPHMFHYECLNDWIDNGGKNCPLCRKPIKTQTT